MSASPTPSPAPGFVVGYLAPGEEIKFKPRPDADEPAFKTSEDAGPGAAWIAECQDCPRVPDPHYGGEHKRQVGWHTGHRARVHAERSAEVHRTETGHEVHLLQSFTMTFSLLDDGPGPGWLYLLGLRDGRHHRDDRCRFTTVEHNWRGRDGRPRSYRGGYWRRWL